jgi:ATP-dependent Clp protease ATP-binding subunit ClpA
LNSHYVDTEYLLLGLLRLGEGTAVDILKSLGVSLESLSAATLVTMGPAQLRVDRPPESVPMDERFDKFTERARKTLQLAQEEAQRFNHNYIGTEHILLGLTREGHGVAARVLYSLGIEYRKVRSSVEFIIGRGDRMVMGEIGPLRRTTPTITYI